MRDDDESMPDDLRNSPINEMMYGSFIVSAYGDERFREAFTAETGTPILPPPKTGLEAAIDKATGARDVLLAKFVAWVTRGHWGWDCTPDHARQAIERSEATP